MACWVAQWKEMVCWVWMECCGWDLGYRPVLQLELDHTGLSSMPAFQQVSLENVLEVLSGCPWQAVSDVREWWC